MGTQKSQNDAEMLLPGRQEESTSKGTKSENIWSMASDSTTTTTSFFLESFAIYLNSFEENKNILMLLYVQNGYVIGSICKKVLDVIIPPQALLVRL